jgi:hypothetical protein
MTPQEFQRVYPQIKDWIDQMLLAHASFARSTASARFARLIRCFSAATLAADIDIVRV